MKFWDYGNSFLLEASRAGGDCLGPRVGTFRYPSYVQDIMGDIFSLGFGPFRWVCTSGDPNDLRKTDQIATKVIEQLMESAPDRVKKQFKDNHLWITKAEENKLVVGSQARILYSDQMGRSQLAKEFNRAIKKGEIKGTIVLSRDHHDVSGTDSPWRETSNITDGSMFCAGYNRFAFHARNIYIYQNLMLFLSNADMSVQNFCGIGFRGATYVALHNGGGTGWGEAINGGFGLVLDGSENADKRCEYLLKWDVTNGISRRCWAGNNNAEFAIKREMEMDSNLKVTMPHWVEEGTLDKFAKKE